MVDLLPTIISETTESMNMKFLQDVRLIEAAEGKKIDRTSFVCKL